MWRRDAQKESEGMEDLAGEQPKGRVGRPEEIGERLLWLCSHAASFVTGAAIPIDGGAMTG